MGISIAVMFVMAVTIDTATGLRDKQMTSNVTQTLDYLLASNRYDKRLRPGFGGSPITISVNFMIKSMGPVSDNDQSFGLDCYFRQHWYDLRLRYEKIPGLEEFSMSWLFLDRVWKPDTYFINGKRSFLHRITVPNKFLRLRHDGFITYSMRLTITASCPMYLKKFPLDAQRCPLILGSYGYTNKDLVYRWTDTTPIVLQKGVEIAQFDLVNVTTEEEKTMIKGGLDFSTVQADFWLKRHTGYFMLQVYVPCGLIVLSSWVSFWIDPDDVAARVALGVTTVLSLTTMGFGGRAQLPKVSYWTALDWFVIICFTSVFSVMIEYAIVNFIDKLKKDIKKIVQRKKDEEESKKKLETQLTKLKTKRISLSLRKRSASFSFFPSKPEKKEDEKSVVEIHPEPTETQPSGGKQKIVRKLGEKLSTTVVAHLKPPPTKKRSKSIPNIKLEQREEEEEVGEVVVGDDKKPEIVVSNYEEDLIDLDTEVRPMDEVIVTVESEVPSAMGEVESRKKRSPLSSWFKNLTKPKGFLRKFKILPKQSDIINMMESPNPPDKFSKIDVQSRRNFPIAFLISLIVYLVAFTYYLTDDFPVRDSNINLYRQ